MIPFDNSDYTIEVFLIHHLIDILRSETVGPVVKLNYRLKKQGGNI